MRCIHFIVLFYLSTNINAQVTISGLVFDESGELLTGVNVFLKDTYDGSATDAAGRFMFETSESGKQVLVASCIGYKTFEKLIDIQNPLLNQQIFLKEEINKIDGVTITAGAFEASDTKKSVILRTFDIVTTAGATADITGVMNTLPGTQTVGEEGRLFVRGGDGREAKTFINGMLVGDPFTVTPANIPSRFRFSPFLFKGAFFSTGGYSAEFGQALSSVLQLNTYDLPVRNQTDISLMSVGADISQTYRKNNTSAYAQMQYTDLQPYFLLVPQDAEWQRAPHSLNTTVHIKHKFGDTGSIQWYNNLDKSAMVISQPTPGNIYEHLRHDLHTTNLYSNLSVKNSLGKKANYTAGLSYTENNNSIHVENTTLDLKNTFTHVKLVFDQELGEKVSLKYGAEWFRNELWEQIQSDVAETWKQSSNLLGTFGEANIYFSNNLMLRAGLRSEYNDLNGTYKLFPRSSLGWKMAENSQLSMAYGTFAQTAGADYLKWQPSLEQEQATHYIMSYQYSKEGRIFRTEAYYKNYRHLITADLFTSQQPILQNVGYGYAKGFELFWRDNKTLKSADYWISYTFLDTERLYGIFPYPVMPFYASKHNMSVVYKQFIQTIRSQVGATYSVASGRPYTDPNTGEFNSCMTPAFNDLSVNLSYLMKPNLILHTSVSNILGFDNIFGYQYNSTPNEQGIYESIPIIPQARRFVFAGLFITLSKDKNANQLNNL